jgi:hypothetical protein
VEATGQTLDNHKMEAADKLMHFSLNITHVELSNTHSRYMRMQHLQYNDITLRGHACKGLKRQVKLLIT